jgi:hypothetical protein
MPNDVRSLQVPDLANSSFCDGRIAWDLIRSAATLLDAGGAVDRIDLSRVRHIRPYEVAIVAGMALLSGRVGTVAEYVAPSEDGVREHLERLNLPERLGDTTPNQAERRATNLPIQVLEKRSDSFGADVTDVLVAELGQELPGGLSASIAESIDEMALNALTHADSPVGCVVVGQAFPKTAVLEVAVLDLGVTIRGHLARAYPDLTNDTAAIQKAFEDGVTGTRGRNRFNEPNSGAGLATLAEFLSATGGELAILSGSAIVCMDRSGRWGTHTLHGPPFRGTLVNIVFSTQPGRIEVGPPQIADL